MKSTNALCADATGREPVADALDLQFGCLASNEAQHSALSNAELNEYERLLCPARERFAASAGVQAIQASED